MIAFGDGAWIALIGGVVSLALLLLVGVIVIRRPSGGLKAKLGALEVTLSAVHDAVNDRAPDQPTLSVQVATMAVRLDDLAGKVDTLADDLGKHILANPGFPGPVKGPPYPRFGQ